MKRQNGIPNHALQWSRGVPLPAARTWETPHGFVSWLARGGDVLITIRPEGYEEEVMTCAARVVWSGPCQVTAVPLNRDVEACLNLYECVPDYDDCFYTALLDFATNPARRIYLPPWARYASEPTALGPPLTLLSGAFLTTVGGLSPIVTVAGRL